MKPNKVKVSIIVPVYNVEKYLSRCMGSLMNQTLKDIEIILVDDGSPDSCPKRCDDFAVQDSRIKVIHKLNGGLGFARNSGLEIASGEFVAFVDSDDYVDLKMYDTLYNQAKELNLDTLFCGFNNVDNKNNVHPVLEVKALKVFDSQNEIQNFLLDMIGTEPDYAVDRKYQMSVWHAIYSRNCIENKGIQFCSEKEFISEDIIFHIDYLQKVNKIGIIPDPMYYYCDNINTASLSTGFRNDRFERYVTLYNEICSRLLLTEADTRAKRMLIGYTRSLLFLLNDYNMTFVQKIKIISSISSNSIWNDIHIQYDYRKLPFYQKIIFILIKKRYNKLLLILTKIKKIYRI
ncbi:glycosyltransferase [Flavobacterium sp. LT1R49]|uniref:glycosyltransferase n=1 Tax=Flavobacterium arabinosi TaxID=3398737 RepID=UPI003A849A23